ncbi:MAG: hypothetical protein WAN65_11360 [Candidatus Sulfotelmatobacter sp.]
MNDLSNTEKIDKILGAHDKGIWGAEYAVTTLKKLLSSLDEPGRESCLEYLFKVLVHQTQQRVAGDTTSAEKQRQRINIPFRVLEQAGRVNKLLGEIFAYFDPSDPAIVNNWANYVFQEIGSAVYSYAGDLSEGTLSTLKDNCALYSGSGPIGRGLDPVLASNISMISRAIESAELSRFEQQIRGAPPSAAGFGGTDKQPEVARLSPAIDEAMRQASEYLRNEGAFDPKKAADLMRTSIDESHREIVKRLADRTGSPYTGGEKDGKRREYLRSVQFISEPEEKFFSAIYTLLSEEASHKLIAPRETILVMEQTVRSYLSLLVRRLSSFTPPKPGANR